LYRRRLDIIFHTSDSDIKQVLRVIVEKGATIEDLVKYLKDTLGMTSEITICDNNMVSLRDSVPISEQIIGSVCTLNVMPRN
jgi:hypothetical protein